MSYREALERIAGKDPMEVTSSLDLIEIAQEALEAGDDSGPRLVCAVCPMTREGVATEADVIIGGTSVCIDHVGYVQDERLSLAISAVRAGR